MLSSLEGCNLGVWISHGEGKFSLPYSEEKYNVISKYTYEDYPSNPNGSDYNIAMMSTTDGRHLVTMPHIERSLFQWNWANYIKERLIDKYPILYTGDNGRSAHEMIIDCREFKANGIEVSDIAKRLMDYGFHAPTVSFPVAGTMMIEPTESEDLDELDRFCDAMISIRNEIDNCNIKESNNLLKNAPHTLKMIANNEWNFPYTRENAAFPLEFTRENKFWPSVRRVDDAYGDRNLICSCGPIELYTD